MFKDTIDRMNTPLQSVLMKTLTDKGMQRVLFPEEWEKWRRSRHRERTQSHPPKQHQQQYQQQQQQGRLECSKGLDAESQSFGTGEAIAEQHVSQQSRQLTALSSGTSLLRSGDVLRTSSQQQRPSTTGSLYEHGLHKCSVFMTDDVSTEESVSSVVMEIQMPDLSDLLAQSILSSHSRSRSLISRGDGFIGTTGSLTALDSAPSVLRWTAGLAGLNPAPIEEDSPFHAAFHINPHQILVRVPCLHSACHRVLKPWDASEHIALQPRKQLPPPVPASSVDGLKSYATIRYFYTLCSLQSGYDREDRQHILLPSMQAGAGAEAYALHPWSRCEYPLLVTMVEAIGFSWHPPIRCRQSQQHLSLPIGAVFSVGAVPVADLDLHAVHFVSDEQRPASRELVYELIFPVDMVDHRTGDMVIGNLCVYIAPPVAFFDDIAGINDMMVFVHPRHPQRFIQQLTDKMKAMRGSFKLTPQLAMIVGLLPQSTLTSFLVHGQIMQVALSEVGFLCEHQESRNC
jgi:hypothetical protein